MIFLLATLVAATSTVAADPDDEKPKSHAGQRRPDRDDSDDDDGERQAQPDTPIVVTARKLDEARTGIDAALGATVYSLTNEAIENRPGGETGSIAATLAQAPGTATGRGGLAIRGSRAVEVRINGVIIPEAISDPADHLSARLAETTRLITGALPAQFGFAPGGVISIATKNGLYERGGQAEFFAGSDSFVEPAVEWAGAAGGTSLFASGSVEQDRSRVASVGGAMATDRRREVEGLAFADHVLSATDRLSLILGGSHGRHRIGDTGIGSGAERSGDGYAVATYQHSGTDLSVETSLFAGAASDESDFARRTSERRGSLGTQIDASYALRATDTLRAGLLLTRATSRELRNGFGASAARRTTSGIYAQNEWRPLVGLTLNSGVRAEWLRGFGSATTIEPRASLVWIGAGGLTAHAGYARFAAAAPLERAGPGSRLPDERDDYLDAGLQQRTGPFTFGVDGYWRSARNLLAAHNAPGSALVDRFAFQRGRLRGVELSATYARGDVAAWANIALSGTRGRGILPGDVAFAPETLAAASQSSLPLPDDRPLNASGGATWRLGKLVLSGDLLVSSGAVGTATATRPDAMRASTGITFGLAAVYHVRIAGQPLDLRVDATNLTNLRRLSNDGSNLEGGWTRFERGRAIAFGIEQGF
jgi:outer membrane cobalamin receptor